MALSPVALLSRSGELEVDPETDTSGARFVTRASVEKCWMTRQKRRKKRGVAEAVVPVAEVARFTGHSTTELADLGKSGALEQVPGRRHMLVTATTLRGWLAAGSAQDAAPDRRTD